jgi:CRISPR-associated protein Cas2
MVFVMYDISENLSRTHFINKLRYYGLIRVQKSVFSGFLDIDERLELINDFELYLSSDNDSIMIIPVCETCKDSIFIEGDLDLPKKESFMIF